MGKDVNQLIAQVLNINDCNSADTSEFKNLKHNNDLVPKFKDNFKKLAKLINPYYNDCYDIQGVTDDGVDVLLKYLSETESETHRIGFQIKSYDDITKKNWLQNLKAQMFEAQGIWKTDDLYIVFCTDAIEHKDELRIAIAEIQKSSDVHIVEPEKALTFFKFNSIDIFTIIYNFYHANDSLLKKARNSLGHLNSDEKEFLINLIVRQFINNEPPIPLEELELPECMDLFALNGSQFFTFIRDTWSLSYCYENNWDLTSFVAEIKANFSLSDSHMEEFLKKCFIDK